MCPNFSVLRAITSFRQRATGRGTGSNRSGDARSGLLRGIVEQPSALPWAVVGAGTEGPIPCLPPVCCAAHAN